MKIESKNWRVFIREYRTYILYLYIGLYIFNILKNHVPCHGIMDIRFIYSSDVYMDYVLTISIDCIKLV